MPQKTKQTPMMEQYFSIKKDYQDAFLFYRLGDFYELFYDDAEKAAQILELTLTSRNKNADDPIPMCGVPYHAATGYIDTLIEKGYKVAICEQVEDPKTTKGMVKREVIQLITPGTVMDGKGLHSKENNYLTAVIKEGDDYGIAYADLSTGEMKVTVVNDEDIVFNELATLATKELIVAQPLPDNLTKRIEQRLGAVMSVQATEQQVGGLADAITEPLAKQAVELLHAYLQRTQMRQLGHLQPAQFYQQWIDHPLIQQAAIERRQLQVASLLHAFFERVDLQESLKGVYDLERLAGRIAFGNVNGRDLLQLKHSLQQVPQIQAIIAGINHEEWTALLTELTPLEDVVALIDEAIAEDAPLQITEGNVIKAGYDSQLDQYREAMRNGKQWLAELEAKERQETGIKNLKVGYNRVFGYYIEISKANIVNLTQPERYDRKQTLANAERFITPELKKLEALILEAEERSTELEYRLFIEVREQVKQAITRLQALAKAISTVDVLQSFATISERYQYVKPNMNQQQKLAIVQGRHPVVEKVLGQQEYIANDIVMDQETFILLITGPNMSGKSTYMRQLALTVILAQIGCFVPAESAELPIFDQIFTRIGASDDLIAGQSTFMVEMMEANQALQHATVNSLILFDELGRGTATYDGMALAQAIIEYIHRDIRAKTLFSTHYHELTVLDQELAHLRNQHVGAVEKEGEVVFLHKMMTGPADKSYGIHVAKLAGLPKELLIRASVILHSLESQAQSPMTHLDEPVEQLSLFQSQQQVVCEEVTQLNLSQMTPLEVMLKVAEWQKKLVD